MTLHVDDREVGSALERPCSECPWRREAAPGWLGPHEAHEWLVAAHGEGVIACHRTIESDEIRQCRGAAIFRDHVCKLPHDEAIEIGPADREHVFENDAEFAEHHGGRVPTPLERLGLE